MTRAQRVELERIAKQLVKDRQNASVVLGHNGVIATDVNVVKQDVVGDTAVVDDVVGAL